MNLHTTLFLMENNNTNVQPDDDGTVIGLMLWGLAVPALAAVSGVSLFIYLCILLINLKLRNNGKSLILGTVWMMPKSYRQYQKRYRRRKSPVVTTQDTNTRNRGTIMFTYATRDSVTTIQNKMNDCVPVYTENVGNCDLGNFDENGEFYPNSELYYSRPQCGEGQEGIDVEGTVELVTRPAQCVTR